MSERMRRYYPAYSEGKSTLPRGKCLTFQLLLNLQSFVLTPCKVRLRLKATVFALVKRLNRCRSFV